MEYMISGTIVYGDDFELVDGYVSIKDGIIKEVGEGKVDCVAEGIVIPSFVNAHTHIGDSVMKDVEFMTLDDLVKPPDGLKHRILKETPPNELLSAMESTIFDMILTGTGAFVDFRESGLTGARLLKEVLDGHPIDGKIFGRPAKADYNSLEEFISEIDGFGISSAIEYDLKLLDRIVSEVKRQKKQVGVHAGEKDRSDIKGAVELNPDHIVHLTKASGKDISLIEDNDIPVVVCPRSNFVTGVGKPPVSEMMDRGITVGIGTDNLMLNSANMFSEIEFLAKIFLHDDRKVFKMGTLNGAKIIHKDKEIGSILPGKKANLVVINKKSDNMRGVKNPLSGIVRRARPDDIVALVYEGNLTPKNYLFKKEAKDGYKH